MHKERDVVGILSILCDIYIQNLTGTKVDPHLEQLWILTSTLFLHPEKGMSNHNFGDTIYDQVLAAQSQCGTFAFGENYQKKCSRLMVSPISKTNFLTINPRKMIMTNWQGKLCVPAS